MGLLMNPQGWRTLSRLGLFPRLRLYSTDPTSSATGSTNSTFPYQIVEQDEDYLFVHKPSNVSMEPKDTFHQEVASYVQSRHQFQPRVVFPIEKGCSGIAVFAKNATAERHFFKVHSKGSTQNFILRYYAAVTTISKESILERKPAGQIMGGLLNSRKGRNKMVLVKKGGTPAITNYERLLGSVPLEVEKQTRSEWQEKSIGSTTASLLCLEPITLRSYQLRATCFSLDAPIIGDKRYSSNVLREDSQMLLHLGYVSFPSRQVNRCYQVKCTPEGWGNHALVNAIREHNAVLPQAVRTNNFLSSKKPNTRRK